MNVGIGIDFGPGRGHQAAIGLDPGNPERLVIRRRLPLGCLVLVGAPLVFCLYAAAGDPSPWGFLGFAAVLGLLYFGRHWRIIDRERKVVEEGPGILFPLWRKTRSLEGYRSVVILRKDTVQGSRSGDSDVTTTARVALEGGEGLLTLVVAGVWEAAVPAAEALAHFLALPIDDRHQNVRRRPEELDVPLIRDRSDPGPLRLEGQFRRLAAMADDGETLLICIARPRQHQYLRLTLPVFVLWTLPVSLLCGQPLFGLLPILILLGSWLKVAYGYGSSLRVSGKGLRVLSRGLVFRRTVEFPLGELEEVARLRPERGGPRNVIADAFDGFLVARSDRASVRFGHGLSWEELDRLREAILAKIATLGRRLPPPLTQEPFRIPALYRPVLPVLGLAAGALLGNFAPRPLGICVALPFLEHVLNLGGLLGLFAGLILERRTAGSGWGKAPFRALLAAVLVAAALLAALRPHDPPFHAGPVHDEWMLFGSKESVKSWGFLFCWIPAGIVLVAAADLLLVSLLAIAIRGPRFLWKGPRPDRRSRVRLGRRVLTGTVAVLTIAGLGLLASFADSYIKEHRRCDHHHHHHNRQHALRAFATRKAAPKPRATSLESAPFRGEVEAREPGRLRVEAEDHGPLDLRAAPLKVEDDRKPMLENVPRGIPLQVTRIDHGEFQTFFFGPVLTRAQFMDLKVDGDAIWVGTELGLLRFAPQPEEAFLYGEESGIPGTRVHSLEVIGGRVVADLAWPTTPGCALGLGGWIFDRSAVSWSPLRHPSQWGFHHDAGTLWIAADRAIRLDLKTEEAVVYKREDGLLHESVSAIATAGREVWFVMFGSYVMASKSFTGGGASRLDLDTGRWKSFTEKDGLAYGYSCGVAADEREVWIVHGDDQRGTSVYDRELGKWTVLRRSAGGVSLGGRVVALEKGSAWFGQSGGLVRFDRVNGQAKPYREQDGIPGYIIGGLDVAKDAVWASAYAYGEAGKVRSAGLVRVPRVAESGR